MGVMKFKLRHGTPPLNVEMWRKKARKRLPDLAWAYVDGGADDLVTVRENMSGFRQWRLRQKVLTGITKPNLGTKIAGTEVALPLGLAPTGSTGLSHYSGDVAVARAAEAVGTRLCLSGAGSYSLEELADGTEQNHWFQLYPFGNRPRVKNLVERAQAKGFGALFVTVDVPVLGNREGERWNGMIQPWTMTLPRALHMATRSGWLHDVIRYRRLSAPHFLEPDPGSTEERDLAKTAGLMRAAEEAIQSAEALSRFMMADLHWDDVKWLRDIWKGPLYVKGVMDADDAAKCVDEIGAQGVIVSNHGGRQLDRTLSSVSALPAIVDKIGDRGEVYLDGGVRRGTDVITALCLGAKGVFIGRPYLYGLGAAGQQGVSAILEIFRSEIERAMVLMGCPSVAELNRSWLVRPDGRPY